MITLYTIQSNRVLLLGSQVARAFYLLTWSDCLEECTSVLRRGTLLDT